MSGAALRWDGVTFLPATGTIASAPAPGSSGTGRLRLDITVLHRASTSLEIGRTVEDCARTLLGADPAGWGVAEPVTQPWSMRELTRLCRERAPRPATLVAVAGSSPRQAVGLLGITRVDTGVLERLQLTMGSRSGVDGSALDALAEAVVRRDARSMLPAWQPGRGDGTRAAGPIAPPTPLGMLVGAAQVAVRGTAHAESVAAGSVTLLGSAERPACWVRTDAPGTDPFDELRIVLRHFRKGPPS